MKRVAITMGEPGGVGPEVALKAIEAVGDICEPVLVGEMPVFMDALDSVRVGFSLVLAREESGPGKVRVVDTGLGAGYRKGAPSEGGGRASFEAISMAAQMAMEGEVDGVVTSPISKEALRMAGYSWPGHTEMLAELTGAGEFGMMLVGGGLRVMLATIHEPISRVPVLITKDAVLRAIRLALRACGMLSVENPRIAVAALNPHAGEGGMFGEEEHEVIAPAVEEASRGGIPVSGPWPPDTVFHRAVNGEFDLVVSMYHDQGLIPIKLLAFHTGVNVTVGLPIVRTSPDHGTAYDIAWKNVADPSSMAEAVRLAASMKRP